MLEAALFYSEKLGLSVIPVKPDKRPFEKWEQYQKERATATQIKRWWEKYPNANIGLVTGKVSGICVVDIDTEEGMEAIREYIPKDIKTPACTTPKGGQHWYFNQPLEDMGNNARAIPGCDFRGEGGYVLAPPSVNDKGTHYKWLEGLKITDLSLGLLPESYISFVSSSSYTTKVVDKGTFAINVPMFEDGRRDNDLFHTANSLIKGGMKEDLIRQILERLILSWGERPDKTWIKTKIESALKRDDKRDRSMTEDIKEWVSVTMGDFSVTQVYQDVTCVTKEEKANARKVLQRMCDNGDIVHSVKRAGVYRIVDKSCQPLDWKSAEGEALDIKWPFRIEELVKTMPKNIIVLAGASNAGKSAFLLNVAYKNMGRFDVQYFSSEMGPLEMRDRISKFDCPIEDWTFTPWERAADFADVIKPDSINIIDFLEVHDEFWKVGGLIKDIFDKLNKGIAVIALQKNTSRKDNVRIYGVGGERSIEKARLYLAMDSGTIRIVKGKNWVCGEMNPNGLKRDFKLVQGCKFIEETEWEKDEG